MTGPAGEYVPVNGLQMYYEVHGAGSPLVLMHGGSCTIEYCFNEILAPLAARRRVIAVEQQGHGHTADIDRPLTYRQMADDTAALLDAIGMPAADFLGWSDGGNVALQVAIRHPRLVRKIVVTGANYTCAGIDAASLEWLAGATPETWPAAIREAYERVAPVPQHFPAFFEKLKKMWLEFEDWPASDLQGIAAEVLVMVGDREMVRAEHAIEMYRLIPSAQLAVLPGTGHSTLIERPDWVLSMTNAFLDAPVSNVQSA